jgi:hypothetical protein
MRLNNYIEHLIRKNGILVSYEDEDGGVNVLTPEFSSSLLGVAAIHGLSYLFPMMGSPFNAILSTLSTERDPKRKIVNIDVRDEEVTNISTRYCVLAATSFFIESLQHQAGLRSEITLPTGHTTPAILIDSKTLKSSSAIREAVHKQMLDYDNPVSNNVTVTPKDAESLSEMFTSQLRRR